MFCLMDVSGSMDQPTKDMAKRFYIPFYLFLTRTYKNVEVVFIRHHTQAKEVKRTRLLLFTGNQRHHCFQCSGIDERNNAQPLSGQ